MRRPFVLDMETSDPDDFITLLFLLGHPGVDLRAVTITPGSEAQASIVNQALLWFGRSDVAVGVFGGAKPNTTHVSGWHYKTYQQISREPTCVDTKFELGWQVLDRVLSDETTLVCGGPLKNLGALIRQRVSRGDTRSLGSVFIQGGFAGEGVVPAERQLDKFRGKTTCPTFNLNGDIPSALLVLEQKSLFRELRFVSKNVAHGVVYDDVMHQHLLGVLAARCQHESGETRFGCKFCGKRGTCARTHSHLDLSQQLIYEGLGRYTTKGVEKKLHDPLAAACAIDPSIGEWAEVDLYRTGGEWGSSLSPGSGVQIITGYDRKAFLNVFCRPTEEMS